jgi:hypothetical protein
MSQRRTSRDRLVVWCSSVFATIAIGCHGRDLRVPPVPRYSDEAAKAPRAVGTVEPQDDPYGGLNPYVDRNLGSLPTVSEAPPAVETAPMPVGSSDPYGQAPVAGAATNPAQSVPPMPSPYPPPG